MDINELWNIYPDVRVATRKSGNNEIDAINPPIYIWMNGSFDEAVKLGDQFIKDVCGITGVKKVKRIGPREFHVDFDVVLRHYTDEGESF